MTRKWYKNGIEAPQAVETENGTFYNYNTDSNELMLRADGYLPENEIEEFEPKVVPQTITMRQARLALLALSKLSIIETAIEDLNDKAITIEWDFATEIDRSNQLVNSLCEGLGMSKDDVDNLFIYANTL